MTFEQKTVDAILEVIEPGPIERLAKELASAIFRDPCRFLSTEDAAVLRKGVGDAVGHDVVRAYGTPERLAQINFEDMLKERDRRVAAEQEVIRLKAELKSTVSRFVDTQASLHASEAACDANFKKYKNACDAVHDLDIKYATAQSEIRELSIRALNAEGDLGALKASHFELRDRLLLKITNQRARINYLEGATHHACGTPLTVARQQLEAEKATTAELRGIVETLRSDIKKHESVRHLGKPEELLKLQQEMFSIRMLLRAWGYSNFDNMAQTILGEFEDAEVAQNIDKKDAMRWRALLLSARIRALGSAGIENDRDGYAHLGMEIWTIYPTDTTADAYIVAQENKLGKEWLIKYADIMIEVLEGKHK